MNNNKYNSLHKKFWEGTATENEKGEYIQESLNRFDWESHFDHVNWYLAIPACPCNICDELYKSWKERGKSLYEDNPFRYKEIIKEEDLKRKIAKQVMEKGKGLFKKRFESSGIEELCHICYLY